METENLFFELLRVAAGAQDNLSRTPSEAEWEEVFYAAQKQSLIGICFAGLLALGADTVDGFKRIGMSRAQYLEWLGLAATIQEKNEIVNKHCIELQAKLSADGIRSSILKGQGVASLYDEQLQGLRQCGDIDIFVDCGRKKTLDYLKTLGMTDIDWDYLHAHAPFYEDTEVELHYRVGVFNNIRKDHRLQEFYTQVHEDLFLGSAKLPEGKLTVPADWLNLFYLLQHAYKHLFSEGLGLRQVMDYYSALKSITLSDANMTRLKQAVEDFGLSRFASGMMWILKHIFNFEAAPWIPDRREGEFLLEEILKSGNMGKMDKRFNTASGNKIRTFVSLCRKAGLLVRHYPDDAISSPVYHIWHFFWKRITILSD